MYFQAGGYLTPTEQQNEQRLVLPVPPDDYPYLVRLLDKANIPQLYQLTGQGEMPLQESKKFGHAVVVLPRNREMRHIAATLQLGNGK